MLPFQTRALQTMKYFPREWCVTQFSVMSDSLRPHGQYSPRDSPSQNTGVGNHSFTLGAFPSPGFEPRSPALQVDSLSAEPPGKSHHHQNDRLLNINIQNLRG